MRKLVNIARVLLPVLLLFLSVSGSRAESIFARYRLPPLDRLQGKTKKLWLSSMLHKRLQQIPVSLSQIEDTETPDIFHDYLAGILRLSFAKKVVFHGRSISELAKFLKKISPDTVVEVTSPKLIADATLKIPSRIHLKGRKTLITLPKPFEKPIFLLDGVREVALSGFAFSEVPLGIVVRNSRQIIISDLDFNKGGTAIACLERGSRIALKRIRLRSMEGPGILLQGNLSLVWLRQLDIRDTRRADNGGAGLVITDASVRFQKSVTIRDIHRITYQALTQPIYPYMYGPYGILVEENTFANNRAQGIYCEGCVGVIIRRNLISGNDKEGICLDWGSSHNLVLENVIEKNGFRRRQTDEDLKRDLVLRFGRLADGSAVAKLPGISLDNAAENIISRNIIRENAGDGVKLVRSSFRNIILFNVILHNARGSNHRFAYAGILIGSAGAEPEIMKLIKAGKFKAPLDYLPSMENIVAANVIDGEHHWGILLDRDTAYNDIYDNTVHHQLKEPLASATKYFNSIVGNSWQIQGKKSLLEKLKAIF